MKTECFSFFKKAVNGDKEKTHKNDGVYIEKDTADRSRRQKTFSNAVSTNSFSSTIRYCGAFNHKDVTHHNMKLHSDGFYICSKCGYKVKSPWLQDREVLSEEDYYIIKACYLALPYYFKLEKELVSEERLKTNALLSKIDDIRSQDIYKYGYDYSDLSGVYRREYTEQNHNCWFYWPVTFRIITINERNIIDFVGSEATAEKKDWINIVNLINPFAKDEEVQIGDKMVQISFSLGIGGNVSNILFSHNGEYKSSFHSIR